MTVVEHTTITLFAFDIVYEFDGTYEHNERFFTGAAPAALLLPAIMPDKKSFADLVQRVEAIRTDGRPKCSLEVKFKADVLDHSWDSYSLLTAAYDAPKNDSHRSSPLDVQHSIRNIHEGLSVVDDTRITFSLDATAHAEFKARLVDPDEQ
jgi:hypothetical protein